MVCFMMGTAVTLGLVMCTLVMYGLMMDCFVMFASVMFSCFESHLIRLAMIDRIALVGIMTSLLLMRALRIGCRQMPIMFCRQFLGSWSRFGSARTVEAGLIDRSIVDRCAVNIGVVNER